ENRYQVQAGGIAITCWADWVVPVHQGGVADRAPTPQGNHVFPFSEMTVGSLSIHCNGVNRPGESS
ncbi:MAG: hypothetical protein ACOVNV_11170, partial [Pirellulaceae bacterium]